ncbi:MAG: reprolysin-like metallopeptidase [Bacteroidota bacterium]
MRKFLMFALTISLLQGISAQGTPNFWKQARAEQVAGLRDQRQTIRPNQYKTFALDFQGMSQYLATAPMEFTPAAKQPLAVDLPTADGEMARFMVWESPIIAPGLSEKYPAIHTYAGRTTDGSGRMVRLGVGYGGFHAYIFETDGREQSIQNYTLDNPDYYMVFRNEEMPAEKMLPDGLMKCGVDDSKETPVTNPSNNNLVQDRSQSPIQLKKFRAAIATKGEYSAFFNNDKPTILTAVVTALNYIVALQERDFNVRLELIANDDVLFFLDPATDPYSGNETGDWMNQNPLAINNIIGAAAYDIGHVFSVYVSGSATGIAGGRVCTQAGKAKGCSSTDPPQGTYFNKVAAHEMCHQMSGSHSWSNCTVAYNDQLAPGYAYEPGSGSSLMGYPGACPGNDVQAQQDPYYHICNIEQVHNFVENQEGNTCGTIEVSDNNPPTATISTPNGLTIPISTPFKLSGSGSDPDGDMITYCWEEYDLGPTCDLGSPTGNAPTFRSFPPTANNFRYFPAITRVATNQTSKSEVLPTYARSMKFRMTVRDNHPSAGGQATAPLQLNVTDQAGPFLVTYPNASAIIWQVGSQLEVTWDVANTNKLPVNCQKVNIKLSTNSGLEFPIVLAANVPNTGRACITVPNNVTNTGRIMVEAADNLFYDMSNANIKIQAATQPAFSICSANLNDQICLPGNYSSVISTAAVGGFNGLLTLSTTSLPNGTTATFSPNPVAAGSDVTMTLNLPDNAPEGTINLSVIAASGAATDTLSATYKIVQNNFSAFALQTPANGASGVQITPTFKWNGVPDADKYEIQVASNPSFAGNLIISSKTDITADTFKLPVLLNAGQTAYWRVRPINDCNNASWSEPFVFITGVQNCNTYTSTDLPKTISANGTPTVESKLVIAPSGIISDVNVISVEGNHTFMKDLEVHVLSPTGTDVLLWKDKCPGQYNFNIGFDDSAPNAFNCPPPTNSSKAKPTGLLSAFNGQNTSGTWTLRVKDNVIGSNGQLSGFKLELCSSVALNAPFIVNNNPLSLPSGSNDVIGNSLLKADDANNQPFQLIFTLMTVPQYGLLTRGGTNLQVGDNFTQAEIDGGQIRYYDYGTHSGNDQFKFSVIDGEGGLIAGVYLIKPIVSAQEPKRSLAFALSPNPTERVVRLSVEEPISSDARVEIYSMEGRLMHNWTMNQGMNSMSLDLGNLPAGVYIVAIQQDKNRGVQKLIIR